jgi:hypothetical protein
LAVVALLAMLGVAGAQERGRHGGLFNSSGSGMLPAQGGGGSNGGQIPPPLDGRAGILDQSQRHCFGQDRQGRRVRVPC